MEVVDENGDKHLYPVNVNTGSGGAGAAGTAAGRKQVMAPSHPQSVNQYIDSYTHGKPSKPRIDYNAAAQAAARTYDVPLLQPFSDRLSGTTQVSRYRKDKPFWILLKQT